MIVNKIFIILGILCSFSVDFSIYAKSTSTKRVEPSAQSTIFVAEDEDFCRWTTIFNMLEILCCVR